MRTIVRVGFVALAAGMCLAAQQPPAPPLGPIRIQIGGTGGTPPPPSSHTVLQPGDFTYLGMFYIPPTVGSRSTRYDLGMTFRRVNGVKKLLLNTAYLYEVTIPLEKPAAPYNTATAPKVWGQTYGSWKWGDVRGMHWDETDKRLYAVFGPYYDPPQPDKRVVFVATLDDATSTKTTYGPWAIATLPYKMAMGGVTSVPSWFASQYTHGKRLALGFGFAYSTMGQNGPGSAGPALTTIAPPSTSTPQFSALPDTPLVAHWWNGNQYQPPLRWARTPDMNLKPAYKPSSMWLDNGIWNTLNGVGYWTWVDLAESAGVWIDTPTKSGMLFAPILATGDIWYESSDTRYQGLKHVWAMYDPASFVPTTQGTFSRNTAANVKPAWLQTVQYPFNRYPLCTWTSGTSINDVCGGTPYYQVPKGMAFDPVDSKLYILMGHPGYQAPRGGPAGFYDDQVVYVYRVS